ncbi:MAG: type II secretory pathway component PulK [Candidatus Omnitrophota bacterium]|jgi:type II secretory pathway component PulK
MVGPYPAFREGCMRIMKRIINGEPVFSEINATLGEKGMTMVEVVLAVGLAAMLCAPLLNSYTNNHHSMRLAQNHLQASDIARSFIEIEKGKTYANMTSQTIANFTISDHGTVDVADDLFGSVDLTVTNNGDSTKTLSSIVTWTMKHAGTGQVNSVNFSTLVADA